MTRTPARQNRTETNDSTKNVKVPAEVSNACTGDSDVKAMVWRVEIPGRLPGLNEYVEAERRNRYKAAKMKREAQDLVILCIRKYMRGVHITRPVYIRYYWHEPNRRRDKSNISGYGRKVIEDALVESGVLRDDGWDEIEGFEDRYFLDKANPRIIVEVEEVAAACAAAHSPSPVPPVEIPNASRSPENERGKGSKCLDITTSGAGNTMARNASASPAPGTTTCTKAMSGAASGTDGTAARAKGHARTTSGSQKKSPPKGRRKGNR